MEKLESYFDKYRKHIIGIDSSFIGKDGKEKKVVYADWIASGRLYAPIEDKLVKEIGPFVSNPHSYSSYTGQKITHVYNEARAIIKKHINADEYDALVTIGSGMTGGLMRLQEILGIKDQHRVYEDENDRPIVFITHMEHHSNHVSWQETCADVVLVPPGEANLVDPAILESELQKYPHRNNKIGAFTACSNVTGIITPYHELAEVMHRHGGICVVDLAASAPYVSIDMHPDNPSQSLDAICFSPHKFLGGPGGCGVLAFRKDLHGGTPCIPGGGNVKWTNPRGDYGYASDVEVMEDGGTPGFMQAIKAALAIRLKEQMDPTLMNQREMELLERAYAALAQIPGVEVVGGTDLSLHRIGALPFNIDGLHYNLVVRLLNDYFGIQVRGGWSCASTYCHFLFDMDEEFSSRLTKGIDEQNMTGKPGWVRVSLHPTMTDQELDFILDAVRKVAEYGEVWAKEYYFEPTNNEYMPRDESSYSYIPERLLEL